MGQEYVMGKGLPAWYLFWNFGTLIWGGMYSRLGLVCARQGWRLSRVLGWTGAQPVCLPVQADGTMSAW